MSSLLRNRQILTEIIESDDIAILTLFQVWNMIKLNVHFSTEIINRRIRMSTTKKYSDFSRTMRENYLSVNPVECTCLFISFSISCSFLYICMFHSYHFLQPKPLICSGKSNGCRRWLFSLYILIPSYPLYLHVLTIIFSKKRSSTFYV